MGHSAYADHYWKWESGQRKKLAGGIAVDALVLQSCTLHLDSFFRGLMPPVRAEELARERYSGRRDYGVFRNLDELLAQVREVVREGGRERCEICLRIEQECVPAMPGERSGTRPRAAAKIQDGAP